MDPLSFPVWGPVYIGGYGGIQAPLEVMAPPLPAAKEEPITDGIKTARQSTVSPSSPYYGPAYSGWGGLGESVGCADGGHGRASPVLDSSYYAYRRMRSDPIVGIGRAMADALIILNTWSYELRDSDAGDDPAQAELLERVKNMWESKGGRGRAHQGLSLREFMLADSCRAKDQGNHTLEIVYGEDENGWTVVSEFAPLLPENTRPLVFQGTRTFAGVRNWSITGLHIDLDPLYCVRFIYDSEGGDFFGRSRFENCKEYIGLKWDIRDKIRTDLNTTIGNIMKVGFPMPGPGDTDTVDQKRARAIKIGVDLTKGYTVIYPTFSIQQQIDLAKNGVDPTKLDAFKISRLDTGTNNFDGFKVALNAVDEQILFGLLCLPRSVKEAEHGAKADAEEHTDSMADMAWGWICYVAGLAQTITDDILEQWGGKEMRGAVRIKPTPLDDETLSIMQQVLTTLLSSNGELGMKMLDLKGLCDKLGVKLLKDFDQAAVARDMATAKAGDAVSAAAKLRAMGHDEAGVKKIQGEKREQDAIPTDADGLAGKGAAA